MKLVVFLSGLAVATSMSIPLEDETYHHHHHGDTKTPDNLPFVDELPEGVEAQAKVEPSAPVFLTNKDLVDRKETLHHQSANTITPDNVPFVHELPEGIIAQAKVEPSAPVFLTNKEMIVDRKDAHHHANTKTPENLPFEGEVPEGFISQAKIDPQHLAKDLVDRKDTVKVTEVAVDKSDKDASPVLTTHEVAVGEKVQLESGPTVGLEEFETEEEREGKQFRIRYSGPGTPGRIRIRTRGPAGPRGPAGGPRGPMGGPMRGGPGGRFRRDATHEATAVSMNEEAAAHDESEDLATAHEEEETGVTNTREGKQRIVIRINTTPPPPPPRIRIRYTPFTPGETF